MLSFQEFFTTCAGFWTTERTYHFPLKNEIERSYTEFQVDALNQLEKQQILTVSQADFGLGEFAIEVANLKDDATGCPGFAIAFDTRSETGETVAMELKALFVPDSYVKVDPAVVLPSPPLAAQVVTTPAAELIQGFYLRNQGYSEGGAIAGRFTYQPTRQTLEMTTYYRRSVAVDQMRFIAPDLRLRTIVTYQRSAPDEPPRVITLVGFGLERKQLPETT